MSIIARWSIPVAAVATSLLSGCSAAEDPDAGDLVGAPEDASARSDGVTGSVEVGTTLIATANVNLRAGPSTSKKIIEVVPEGSAVTVVAPAPTSGFYEVEHHGLVGFCYGQYLKMGAAPDDVDDDTGGSSLRADAIARAKAGVGFSYWWGHGRFRPEGPTPSTKGKCSGSCPSCSHSGSYGGDCSGFAAKVWQVPADNDDLAADDHPFSTVSFDADSSLWSTVPRADIQVADAMVYNSNGAGHMFVYEKGDGWGSMYAYECKGCSAGCIKGFRTASSAYHAITREGF